MKSLEIPTVVDTDSIGYTDVTGGSRVTYATGYAAYYAGLDLQKQLVGLVAATPEASVLYTKPDHTGNTWCTGVDTPYDGCTQDEKTLVGEWVELEAN